MTDTEEFESERLMLRPWAVEEVDRLLDIRSREEVAKWLASADPWTDRDAARERIEAYAALVSRDDPFGEWAIVPKATGIPSGTVNLGKMGDTSDVDIGWLLHPDSSGSGYASEAARTVLDHARRSDIETVWAVMWPHNEASAAVAARIGMTDLGVVDDPWYGTPGDPKSRVFRIDLAD